MTKILDDYFAQLDTAPISPVTIFKSEQDKDRYETLLTYAYRKYEAADYHFRNVGRFITEEVGALEQNDKLTAIVDVQIAGKATFQFTQSVDKYIYELSAFLEALKSSLDLLAEVCSFYLVGVTVNYSIQPLIRLVGKGKAGPILDEIAKNLAWLKGLREYRHYLVHRLMPSAYSGYEMRRIGSKKAKVRYPVVVPQSTPSFAMDTRRSRMIAPMGEDEGGTLPGLAFIQSVGKWQKPDGTEEVMHFELSVSASSGYKPIEEFMKFHLYNYEGFFEQIISAFEKAQFKPIAVRHAS